MIQFLCRIGLLQFLSLCPWMMTLVSVICLNDKLCWMHFSYNLNKMTCAIQKRLPKQGHYSVQPSDWSCVWSSEIGRQVFVLFYLLYRVWGNKVLLAPWYHMVFRCLWYPITLSHLLLLQCTHQQYKWHWKMFKTAFENGEVPGCALVLWCSVASACGWVRAQNVHDSFTVQLTLIANLSLIKHGSNIQQNDFWALCDPLMNETDMIFTMEQSLLILELLSYWVW